MQVTLWRRFSSETFKLCRRGVRAVDWPRCLIFAIGTLYIDRLTGFLTTLSLRAFGPWMWTEFTLRTVCTLAFVGFFGPGHLLYRLLCRCGAIGYATIGALMANTYLFASFALCEPKSLQNPRLDTTIALACLAAFKGAWYGLFVWFNQYEPEKASNDEPPLGE
jgi:hypothetical protein